LGIVLTVVGAGRSAGGYAHIKTLLSGKRNDRTAQAASESGDDDFMRMLPLALEIAKRHQNLAAAPDLEQRLNQARAAVYRDLGVLVPEMKLRSVDDLGEHDWRLSISEVPAAGGKLPPEAASGMRGDAVEFLANQAASVLRRQASQFLGIQEVNVLVAQMSQDHPELVKEMLRAVPLQKVADVLRRLVEEGVSVRNLRAIFETLADVGQREKDAAILTEYVRTGLKRYLSSKYVSADGLLRVILLHPELEEKFRQSVRVAGGVAQLALDPELAGRVLAELRVKYGSTSGAHSAALLTSIDIRRHVRKLTEIEFFELPVLSYQELASDIKVQPIAQLGAPRDERLSVAARDGSVAGTAAAQHAGAA
jgi:type III secretion protein V